MPKKQLPTEAIANELQHSVFFSHRPSPAAVPDESKESQTVVSPVSPRPTLNTQPANDSTERSTRTVEPNGRTEEAEQAHSLLDELTQGVKTDRRPTERYSFEIYSDQIPQIEELQYLYKKRTGQKLPASRILREALEAYLHNAFEALKRKK